jgi:hypothetical protein
MSPGGQSMKTGPDALGTVENIFGIAKYENVYGDAKHENRS